MTRLIHLSMTLLVALASTNAAYAQSIAGALLGEASSSSPVIAVAAFSDNSKDRDLDWLSHGFADMLSTDLASTGKVRVVARLDLDSVIREQKLSLSDLMDPKKSARMGELISADTVLTGSFMKIGNTLRVDAKLYETTTGLSRGVASVQDDVAAIFAMEKTLAVKILATLGITLAPSELVAIMQIPSPSLAATRMHLEAQELLHRGQPEKAQDFLNRALEIDPYFRLAASDLQKTQVRVSGVSLFQKARTELERKDAQLKAVEAAVNEFLRDLLPMEIGEVETIETDASDPTYSVVVVPVRTGYDEKKLEQFYKTLQTLSAGTEEVRFRFLGRKVFAAAFYPEVWKALRADYLFNRGVRYYWELAIMDSDGDVLQAASFQRGLKFTSLSVDADVYHYFDMDPGGTQPGMAPRWLRVRIETKLLPRIASISVKGYPDRVALR